jgi:SAM-dependent methyltransferase
MALVAPSQIYTPRLTLTRSPLSWIKAAIQATIRLSVWGLPIGHHMTRYAMYHHIERTIPTFAQPAGARVLALSRSNDMLSLISRPDAVMTAGEYPEYDVLSLSNVADHSYDYLLCDQVLEHLEGNPQDAFDAVYRVLKPGGIAVLTTCMMQEIHGGQKPNGEWRDYYRFTPWGLKYLAKQFSRAEHGSWGNRAVFFGLRYLPVPHAEWHPLHKIAMYNQERFPILTWVIVQK